MEQNTVFYLIEINIACLALSVILYKLLSRKHLSDLLVLFALIRAVVEATAATIFAVFGVWPARMVLFRVLAMIAFIIIYFRIDWSPLKYITLVGAPAFPLLLAVASDKYVGWLPIFLITYTIPLAVLGAVAWCNLTYDYVAIMAFAMSFISDAREIVNLIANFHAHWPISYLFNVKYMVLFVMTVWLWVRGLFSKGSLAVLGVFLVVVANALHFYEQDLADVMGRRVYAVLAIRLLPVVALPLLVKVGRCRFYG